MSFIIFLSVFNRRRLATLSNGEQRKAPASAHSLQSPQLLILDDLFAASTGFTGKKLRWL
ncbi:MAG: hypothetical protein WBN75_03130 [Verrucomicrobiia bacterium]